MKKGVAALIAVISIGALITIIGFSSAVISYWANQNVDSNKKSLKAYYAAYSGIQDALIKLERNKDYTTNFNLSINATNDVSIAFSGGTITSTSTLSQINKKLQTVVIIDSTTGLVTPTSTSELSL